MCSIIQSCQENGDINLYFLRYQYLGFIFYNNLVLRSSLPRPMRPCPWPRGKNLPTGRRQSAPIRGRTIVRRGRPTLRPRPHCGPRGRSRPRCGRNRRCDVICQKSEREARKEIPGETRSDRTDSPRTVACSDVGEEEVEVDERRHHRLIEHLRLQLRGVRNAFAAVAL